MSDLSSLTLMRRTGESFIIGNSTQLLAHVCVFDFHKARCLIRVTAPRGIPIERSEISSVLLPLEVMAATDRKALEGLHRYRDTLMGELARVNAEIQYRKTGRAA